MPAKREDEEIAEAREDERKRPDPTLTGMFVPPKRPPGFVDPKAPAPSPQAPAPSQENDTTTATVTGIEKLLVQSPASSSGPQGTIVVQKGPSAGPSASATIPKKGDRIGGDDGRRFEIMERLGAGGMAVVLLAKDTLLDRTVAIKFITHEVFGAGGEGVVERFKLEARASARVAHENIVRIFDLGTANGVPFLVMEHLEGRPLDSIEANDKPDALRCVRIMIDVARGLSHAHKSGIVHRDLKPSNVFIIKDGRAKIVDFGLASMAFGVDSRGAEWHALAGTPRYMSPEQWKGEQQDARTDIWAAGVMLFELLVGHPPFRGESIFEVRNRVLSPEAAPLVRQFRPDLPEEAARLIEHALMKEVAERLSSADELLDGLVALEVALARGGHAGDSAAKAARAKPERRQMTFLSVSLSNFLTLAEQLELDDFSELLESFFDVCATVVRQLEGSVVSSVGGRVIACFGYPIAHEDDAQRAVRAGFLLAGAIRSLTRKDGNPHTARIGVHTNIAIAARLAEGTAESTAIIQGDAPHIATWLEERASEDAVLISQRTQTLVHDQFELEALGPVTPEGATRTLETYRALRAKATDSRFKREGEALTPLVGRDSEVANLRRWWGRVKAGDGQFVMLIGEAGIGKSRMVELLKEQASTEAHRIGCQSWPHFKNTPLYPIGSGLMGAAGIRVDMPAADKLRKLEAWLSDLGLSLEVNVPLFASVLSIPLSGGYKAPTLSPDLLKNTILEALQTALLRLAEQKPTLLVLEDVHWSDSLTVELLGLLIGRLPGSRLFLLVTFRPDFTPPWPERPYLHRVVLQRLSSSQTQALAALATRGRALPREVMEQIVRRADGIPLFVEELARMVGEAWQQAEQSGRPISAQAFASATIPASLSELLLARLDRLAEGGKEVAQLGAVLGREFSYQLIQLSADIEEHVLRFGLMQLVEAGMLRQEGDGEETRYVFKHALIQDAAYQSLVRNRRQEHHLRAAQTLVKYFPEVTEPHPELIGHHFAEAGRAEEAIDYLEKGGQNAVARSATIDAVTHFSRAIAQLMTLPPGQARDRRELPLQIALGAQLMPTKGYANPQVREAYARARTLCELAGDDAALFPAASGLWYVAYVGGEVEISAKLALQLLAQAEAAGDTVMLMVAHNASCNSAYTLGNFVYCREQATKCLALYDREQHGKLGATYGNDPAIASGACLSWALWYLGFPDQAVQRGMETVQLARANDHPSSLLYAMSYLATVHNFRGEFRLALDILKDALDLAAEKKLDLWTSLCTVLHGWALLGTGDRAAGAAQLREGVDAWLKTGAKTGNTFFLPALIADLWQSGKLAEAMAKIEESEACITETGERLSEAEILRLRGEVMLAQDPKNEGAAEECFRRALDVARRQQARAWELRVAMSLARLLAKRGSNAEGRSILMPVYEWFQEGQDTGDLREARALLDTL